MKRFGEELPVLSVIEYVPLLLMGSRKVGQNIFYSRKRFVNKLHLTYLFMNGYD